MSQKPKGRKKHTVENAKVEKIEKKEALNIEAIGDKLNLLTNLFSKLKGKKQ